MRFAAGISFSIPIDAAKDFLSQAIERVKSGNYTSSRSTRRPLAPYQRWYIGISMLTLTPQILEELRRRDQSFNKVTSGVFVPQVNYGSPAYRQVVSFTGVVTSTVATYMYMVLYGQQICHGWVFLPLRCWDLL